MAAKDIWYPAKDEKNVSGRFGIEKIYDIPASVKADTEIYKDILVLYTQVSGETDRPGPIKVLPDNRMDLIRRFPDAWKAWETKAAVEIKGTPLDALELGEDKALQLRLFGVYRVEQLATLTDQQCEHMGFGTKTLRNKAMEYLAAGKAGETPTAPAKRRGRPPKVQPDSPATEAA